MLELGIAVLAGCAAGAPLEDKGHLSLRAIDGFPGEPHHEHMNDPAFDTTRRSQRVFHKMRLQAQGRGHDGRKFREVCETLVVNAHGGLLLLRNEVDQGETIVLVNPLTQDEQECRIVFTGESGSKGIRVGVEFLTPAPRFWGIDFEAKYSSVRGEMGRPY